MRELYADYGVDVVEAVSEELIDQSEWLVRNRLTELPDGEWRVREYIDMPGANAKVELTATKEGDSLTYDFTGSSPQTELGVNCSYWATWGGLFAPIFPLLAWDVTWNEGVTRPIRLVAPGGDDRQLRAACADLDRDRRNHPDRQQPLDARPVEAVRRKRTEREPSDGGLARQPRARRDARLHGEGEFFVAPLTDTFCGAAGARAFADGVDLGGEIPNVVSRWANAESQELNTPMRYLFRRAVPDSGGPGSSAGVSATSTRSHRTGRGGPWGWSLREGHARADEPRHLRRLPGCNVGYTTFRDANVDELPDRLEALRGAEQVNSSGAARARRRRRPVRPLHGRRRLRRRPRPRSGLVLRDVLAGLVTEEPARDVYGVVVDGDDVDAEATRARRRELREARLGRPFDGPDERADVPRTGRRLSEYLQRTEAGRRSAHGAVPRSRPMEPTGRSTPSCAGSRSRKPGHIAPPRASSS